MQHINLWSRGCCWADFFFFFWDSKARCFPRFSSQTQKSVVLLILLSEWHETLKEGISSTSCATWQRYLPVYTTPLSSTDMLMLLVPLVVRFRAESCLPSKRRRQQSAAALTKHNHLHCSFIQLKAARCLCNTSPELTSHLIIYSLNQIGKTSASNFKTQYALTAQRTSFNISLKSPVFSLQENSLHIISDTW